MRLQFAYIHPFDHSLWLLSDQNHWTKHTMLHKSCHNVTFQRQNAPAYKALPSLGLIPIKVTGKTEEIYIRGQAATFVRPTPKQPDTDTLAAKLTKRSSETLLYNITMRATEELHDCFEPKT
jgi:hypothetical protein